MQRNVKRMATIKDIAKIAGVAQGTVSNVLNGRGNVSSDKIRRVLDAC
ncbi:MAG: LacI family DNA-binding transcriptional regulator, partial [Candidatus Ventricola sp.]|nr:LacI family DNA-binding transcriptional regulator [Candidatus Ventricola sp.]